MSSSGIRFLLATATVLTITIVRTSGWSPRRHCQPLGHTQRHNFYQIAQHTWYETFSSPATRYHCVVRKYSMPQYAMLWADRISPRGNALSGRKYVFSRVKDPHYNIQVTNNTYFQQILDTDNANWVLQATCFEREGQLKFQILQTNPYVILSEYVRRRIYSTLAWNGLYKQFVSTHCSPGRAGIKARLFDNVRTLHERPSTAVPSLVSPAAPEDEDAASGVEGGESEAEAPVPEAEAPASGAAEAFASEAEAPASGNEDPYVEDNDVISPLSP